MSCREGEGQRGVQQWGGLRVTVGQGGGKSQKWSTIATVNTPETAGTQQ
jgi:hypothetical protein